MSSGLDRFIGICAAMEDPDFELTCEEFPTFYAAFRDMRRSGVPFDSGLIAMVEALNHGMRGTAVDGDDDHDRADEEESEQPATSYSVDAVATSDECLTSMLDRREQERRWI